MENSEKGVLLEVDKISVEYHSGWGRKVNRAVNDVSLTIARGECVALVGESGSGKSTIGRAILGLEPVAEGAIRFDGEDVTRRRRRDRRRLAARMQVVFQDPYSSLNPAMTVGEILTEPIRALSKADAETARNRLTEVLERVGLPADTMSRYASRFSGGQRQRIAIARALVPNPDLILCDEPTSALDVSTQAAVLELLSELRAENGTAFLFITHDLAVVRHFADRVAVLRRGGLVESGTAEQVSTNPQHPYTRALVAAAPVPDPVVQRQRREARRVLLAEGLEAPISA